MISVGNATDGQELFFLLAPCTILFGGQGYFPLEFYRPNYQGIELMTCKVDF
jgi:hypothetical protein